MAPKKSGRKQKDQSTFANDAEELFGTTDLYEILSLDPKSDSSEKIKKAYYKASLKYHPDRIGGVDRVSENEHVAASANDDQKQLATRKFQLIGKAYAILSDADKRKIYDETGVIDDDSIVTEDRDWAAYWRLLFKPVTLKDLQDFEKQYKGSAEERRDLVAAYLKHEGDMDKIFEEIMCSNELQDEERFREILGEMVESDEIPNFPKFSGESVKKKQSRKRKAEVEAAEAKAELEKINSANGGREGLEKMIQKRQSDRAKTSESFLDQLAEKYGKKGRNKKK